MTESTPKIVMVGDPVLARTSREVTNFDAELAELIERMFASLAVAEGVGLAAPQVGIDLAVFVYDCPDADGTQRRGYVINPHIEVAGERMAHEEGCLSVPGPYAEIERWSEATVRGVDRHGEPIEVHGGGFFARCLQHETDHLKGVLYVDYLPRNRRRRVLREMVPFDWNVVPAG